MHRKNEPCASCHKLMDPIGFALENFDADGKWRTKQGGDGGVPIDASAVLWDGTKVNGPIELRQALLQLFAAVRAHDYREADDLRPWAAEWNITICP